MKRKMETQKVIAFIPRIREGIGFNPSALLNVLMDFIPKHRDIIANGSADIFKIIDMITTVSGSP